MSPEKIDLSKYNYNGPMTVVGYPDFSAGFSFKEALPSQPTLPEKVIPVQKSRQQSPRRK